jgi:hypothetical protein
MPRAAGPFQRSLEFLANGIGTVRARYFTRKLCSVGLLAQYSYLQILDLLTTLAFLGVGVQEANPLVALALGAGDTPVVGLAIVKAVALLLGVYCWRAGRLGMLVRVIWLFAALVTWNLLALILASRHIS